MATDMAVGMAVWMSVRGHPWRGIAEISAAMYAPFLVLLIPYRWGAISAGVVMNGGHVLMLLSMLVVMLRRRDEYTRGHAHTMRFRVGRGKALLTRRTFPVVLAFLAPAVIAAVIIFRSTSG
jgi:hypothetical protein